MRNRDHELIAAIYQSSTDPALWPEIPRLLAESLGTHQAIIIRAEQAEIHPADITTYGIDHEIRQKYIDILDEDLWLDGMLSLANGAPCRSDQFLRMQDLKKTKFYQLLCKPSDVAHMGGAVVRNDENVTYLFAGQRDTSLGVFQDSELAHIRMLVAHFDRARTLRLQLGSLQNSVRTLRRVLDKSAYGVFLIDEYGIVSWCNEPGERLVRKEDGLALRLSRLQTTVGETNQALGSAVAAAIATSQGHGTGSGDYLSVRRPSGKRPYQLTISPIGENDAWGEKILAVVFVLDPDSPPEMPLAAVRELFGLSPAEARVTRELVRGFSVAEIANRFEVSSNTVRTQLKSILRKCDVQSQGGLLQLLARVALQ